MQSEPRLSNPEREWERPSAVSSIDTRELERRVGKLDAPAEVLSGGLRNATVKLDADRVLRLYRVSCAELAKELTLLRKGWRSFRVPAVLDVGEDFIVLEYVPHEPLSAQPEHGAAVGRALAEIHETTYQQGGLLNERLQVESPFANALSAIEEHAAEELSRAQPSHPGLLDRVRAVFATEREDLLIHCQASVLLHADFKVSNLHWTRGQSLLVLDWEFAFAGPALLDIGQLLRWHPPEPFISSFADSYRATGGTLHDNWRRACQVLDLVNLAGLLAKAALGSRRARDVESRICETLATWR